MVDCFPTSFSISSSAPQICNIPGSVKVIMIPTVVTALTTATATTSSSSFQLETAQNNPEDPLDLSCKSSGNFYSSADLLSIIEWACFDVVWKLMGQGPWCFSSEWCHEKVPPPRTVYTCLLKSSNYRSLHTYYIYSIYMVFFKY